MQKWTAVVFALLPVAAVAVIVGERSTPSVAAHTSTVAADAGPPADAGTGAPTAPQDAGKPDAAARAADGGESAPAPAGDEQPVDPLGVFGYGASDAGTTLPDGTVPPALTATAPKSVVFGVILVQYKGAQGAPANARSREEALKLANQIAADAKTDFKAAVAKGDKGSMDNAGRMPRGMLEPAPEYVLFSLPKDGVSEPVDTPRGFWIVKRIE